MRARGLSVRCCSLLSVCRRGGSVRQPGADRPSRWATAAASARLRQENLADGGEVLCGCRRGAARGDAAVDDEVLAGDEGGSVAREPHRERRDVVGPSGAPDRLVRLEAFGEYRLEFLGLAVGLCRVDAGTFGEDP